MKIVSGVAVSGVAWIACVGVMVCAARIAIPVPAPVPVSSPVLVELFTSEGCSSCPPADQLLEQFDTTQGVPGAQLIVLSEHVDYWDHDGWKDPYSSPLMTKRQSDYVHALGLDEPYTPQIIVDGNILLKGNPEQIGELLAKAAAGSKIEVRVDSARAEGTTPPLIRAHITAQGNASTKDADIYAAVALNHAESQVLRGENGGHRLSHVAVVEYLKKIGTVHGASSFERDFEAKLKPGIDPANVRIVAFVQAPGPGKVLGAGLQKIEAK
jgi:hypothetical protein